MTEGIPGARNRTDVAVASLRGAERRAGPSLSRVLPSTVGAGAFRDPSIALWQLSDSAAAGRVRPVTEDKTTREHGLDAGSAVDTQQLPPRRVVAVFRPSLAVQQSLDLIRR